MHDLKEGQALRISDPRNRFPLAPDVAHHVLLAGGIGVTPILCMAEQLASVDAAFEMHYCARFRDRAAFVERIGRSAYGRRVHFHFDDGSDDQKLDLDKLLKSHEGLRPPLRLRTPRLHGLGSALGARQRLG